MQSNKKFRLLIVGLFVLVIGSVGFLAVKSIQDNRALQDSEAAGFGKNATSNNYAFLEQDFSITPCAAFLSPDLITSNYSELLKLNNSAPMKVLDQDVYSQQPKNCAYYFGNGDKKIYFGLKTYTIESKIDNTQSDLFNRIQSAVLSGISDGGRFGSTISYFLGSDKDNDKQCTNLIFHDQNDFEYAYVTYEGFGGCDNVKSLNKEITELVSAKIISVMSKYSL